MPGAFFYVNQDEKSLTHGVNSCLRTISVLSRAEALFLDNLYRKFCPGVRIHFPALLFAPGWKCFRINKDLHHDVTGAFNFLYHFFCPNKPVGIVWGEEVVVREKSHQCVPIFFFVPDHSLNVWCLIFFTGVLVCHLKPASL